MGRSRLEILVRSEVARWREWQAGVHATAVEIEAWAARRDDYGSRCIAALRALPGEEETVLAAVEAALVAIREQPWRPGVPEVSDLVTRVQERLAGRTRRNDPCARCEREGGVLRYGRERVTLPKQPAHTGPWQTGGPKEPVCVWHAELLSFEVLVECWRDKRPVKVGGLSIEVCSPPRPPWWYNAVDAPPA